MGVLASLARFALDVLLPPREDERIVRALPESALLARVEPILLLQTRPHTTGLLPFRDETVRALIHEAKYHDSRKAQQCLSAALAEYLAEFGTDSFASAVIVPLPLSRKRYRERGFNQCERIASLALAAGRSPLSLHTDILVRTKDTEHQARLTRSARHDNVAGAFSARASLDPSLVYILFDDVVTTGATMQAGIDALRAAGAKHIFPLALAR